MIIFDEQRASDSPFVERIWRSHSERGGSFLSIAESRSEMVVTKHQGKITLTVRGPETKATPLGDCPAEGEWLGIQLKPGTFLPPMRARTLVDAAVTLPEATNKVFPRALILKMSAIPRVRGTHVMMFDTSGEAFVSVNDIIAYARYVKRSPAVVWLISLENLESPDHLDGFLTVFLN